MLVEIAISLLCTVQYGMDSGRKETDVGQAAGGAEYHGE